MAFCGSARRRAELARKTIDPQSGMERPLSRLAEFQGWNSVDQCRIEIKGLRRQTILTRNTPLFPVSSDAKDDMFFACAKAAGAVYIVSKDKHIVTVGEYFGIKTVKPGYFVEQILNKRKEAA